MSPFEEKRLISGSEEREKRERERKEREGEEREGEEREKKRERERDFAYHRPPTAVRRPPSINLNCSLLKKPTSVTSARSRSDIAFEIFCVINVNFKSHLEEDRAWTTLLAYSY